MSNITDFLKYELYPALYDRIDEVFTEHSFKRYAGGWRSKTYLDGAPHKSRGDKTVISRKAIGCILEQGGDSKSLVDYVADRDKVGFIQAVRTLAKAVGLTLPKGEIDQNYRSKVSILEDANSYFMYCLKESPNADEVRKYLASRGYTTEEVEAMELGYIPSIEKLETYLRDKRGHSYEAIKDTLQLTAKGIGETHRLTIPYRSGGTLKGFKFRTIGDAQPKYLNSTGLDRSGGFFNLLPVKGDKDIVIVEGELDSLIATARGVDNIVALGGSSISSDQIRDAVRLGAKSFTICLDNEPQKKEKTAKAILDAIEVIRDIVDRVYIVELPDLDGVKTDADSLIRAKGIEAFKAVLADRLTYGAYTGSTLYTELTAKAKDGEVDILHRDLIRQKAVELRSSMSLADREDFNRYLEALEPLGFKEDILAELEEDYKEQRAKAKEEEEARRLIRELQLPANKGKAIEVVEDWIKTTTVETVVSLLPPASSFSSIIDQIADLPPAKETGYKSLDEIVGFTPASLSLIAGRPSHGKTTLLFNLLLEMTEHYSKESFYFFTYEEPLANITVKLLNRLTAVDLGSHYREIQGLAKPTNYEFIKAYIRSRRTDIAEIENAKKTLAELVDSKRLVIVDRNYSVEELRSLLAYLNSREKIGAVFIDYIQRLRTARKTQDKRTEVAHISDILLQTAKETGLPLILGAQLNRESAKTGDKKPKLEHLKEAGNLEEDANTVISVYNEAREEEVREDGTKYSDLREVELELKVLKNREGEPNAKRSLYLDKWTGVLREDSVVGSLTNKS